MRERSEGFEYSGYGPIEHEWRAGTARRHTARVTMTLCTAQDGLSGVNADRTPYKPVARLGNHIGNSAYSVHNVVMDLLSLPVEQRLTLYTTLLGDSDPSLPIGAWEWIPALDRTYWSAETLKIVGLPPGKTMNSPVDFFALIHPDDLAHVQAMSAAAAETGKAPPMEYRLVRPDKRVVHLRARGQTFEAAGDHPARLIGTLVDRTAQVETGMVARRSIKHQIELVAPSRGGAGLMVLHDVRKQLSLLQHELLSYLIAKLEEDCDEPESTRGFVPSIELLSQMSWDTPRPSVANLKQVIRRTRALLHGSALSVVSRRSFGYRLWWANPNNA